MHSLRSSVLETLDYFHLGQPARRAKQNLWWLAHKAKRTLAAHVLWGWTPLVPEVDFLDCCRHAIKILRQAKPDHVFGDYLEFGVSRGTSLACMYQALSQEGLHGVRLLGFDSFEGFPPEAAAQGWLPGDARSTLAATQRYLADKSIDMARVALTKGWFKDTLTAATKDRLEVVKASLVMVDCDIYTASRDALLFCGPLIDDQVVIFFDDWGWMSDIGQIGQKEAFDDFLAAFPQLTAEPLPSYLPQARVFLVTRRATT